MAEQQQIGIYRIIKSLGGGGMGVVYLAEDTDGGGLYALKLLSPSMTPTEKESRRFRREFMTMSRLRHPNIVEVYESGVYEDSLYFVMEYVKGAHLRDRFLPHPYPDQEATRPLWLQEMNQPRRTESIVRGMIQICDALSWIHAHGIIHRDLKPENILVKADGQIKLLDFGIAKRLGGSELTQSKSILGTFTYISPEQAQCEDVDGRADLYSLGVIFYEILAGRPPFVSAEPIGRLYMHLNKPAPPLRDWNPLLHPEIETIILKLLQKDPAERYQTAEALRFDLETLLQRIAPDLDPYTTHEGERILREPSFVGRGEERQILMRHLELLQNGKGGLVLLSGHTGIGKTRLAREFLASARAYQIECCTVRCHPEAPPYAAFQEIIEQLRTTLCLREADLSQRLWGKAGETWFRMMENPSKAGDDASPLPMGFSMDTLTPSSGSAEDEKIQLFEAARQMLEAFLTHEPLLFCLDDMMFVDEMSLELTEYLIRTLEASPTPHKLLVLAVFRNEDVGTGHPINQMMVRLTPLRLYALHDLKPMNEDTIAQMALSMLGYSLSTDALSRLSEQSQGNPFFIEEIIKAWWEERLLIQNEGLYTLLPSDPASEEESPRVGRLPAALQKRLSRRISRLSPPSYGLAQWMAVLHHDSSFELLQRLTKIGEEQLLAMLDELLQQKILVEDWASGAEQYRFSHPGIQEILYSQMPDDQKRQAHQIVAEQIRQDPRTEGSFESLAQHFLSAGDTDQGAWYLLLATERQLRAFAHRSAWQLSQRCRRLLVQNASPNLQPKSAWWWRYHLATLELMDVIGHYREGLELVEFALTALDDTDDPTPLLRWQAVFSRELGFYLEALACVKQALAHPRLQDDLRLYLLQESGRVYRVQGRYSAALEAYREALGWAVDRKLVWEQGRISGMIGQVLHQRGEFSEAEAHYLRALEISTQAADRRGEVESLCKLGALELDKGYVGGSIQRFEKAIQLARELGDRRMEGTALALLGQLQSDRRMYDDAQEKLEYALLIAQEIGDQRMEGELLSWLGLLCYRQQHLDAARYYLEEGIAKVRQLGDRLLELWIRCYLCVVELLEKRSTQEDALEEMSRIARLSEQMEASEIILLCKLVTAHIYRLLRQKEPAKDYLTAARFLAYEVGNRRLLAKIESERYLLGKISA